MQTYGEIFRTIRIGKNMTLKDVSQERLSLSFLSKFERGESEISLSRFIMLLDSLNVSIEEFYKLVSQETPKETEKLLWNVSQAYYDRSKTLLEQYHYEEQEKFHATNRVYHRTNAIMIEAFMCAIDGTYMRPESSGAISEYLFGVDYWGKYELMLFGNTMQALAPSTLQLLMDELTKKTEFFGSIDENYIAKVRLLINAASISIENHEKERCTHYFNELELMELPDVLLYEKFELEFTKGLYEMKFGNRDCGMKSVESTLNILKILEANTLYESRKITYERLLNSTI